MEANPREVRLKLEGENLAQQISVVLRYGALDSFQFKVPAVDILSTADGFAGALGRVLVTLRVFVDDDGEIVEHRATETIRYLEH